MAKTFLSLMKNIMLQIQEFSETQVNRDKKSHTIYTAGNKSYKKKLKADREKRHYVMRTRNIKIADFLLGTMEVRRSQNDFLNAGKKELTNNFISIL